MPPPQPCTIAMSVLRAVSFAFATTLVASAQAYTLSTSQPAASGVAAAGLATRDQLRDCMMTEASLKQRYAVLEARSAEQDKMNAQIEAESNRLTDLQAQLDHDSTTAVKAFNKLVDEHNRHVKEFNQVGRDMDPASHAYNEDMAAFNRRCSAQHYSVEDMEAVMQERKKAEAANASAH